MELQAGMPARKENKRGAAYAYNVKELRDREIEVARHAESGYERLVSQWQPRRPKPRRTGAATEERS
jgi:transposase